ncbi:MAG TPA: DnaJ domain-containing protein [Vicinamibacteria bacterium]|nr:DnaJ domain-containing protein [Vicinamibacteria bacterium]
MADFYGLLGVTASASTAEIRQAYLRLARDRHPDHFTDPAEKRRAEVEFQDLTTAFNTLVNPRTRQEYDEAQARPQPRGPAEMAADAFARAQPLLQQGRVEEAVRLLRAAVHHAPEVAAHQAALGGALARLPSSAREAVQVLEKAAQLDPGSARVFAELAVVLAGQGLRLRAQKALETAQRLAPHDPRVQRLAGELGFS